MQARVPRLNRRAIGWLAFGIGGVVIYTLVLWADFVFLQNLPVQGALSVAVQQTFNALSIGSIYALIALGYTMVYGIIELINFAHGDIFMIGAFLGVVWIGGIMGQTGAVDGHPAADLPDWRCAAFHDAAGRLSERQHRAHRLPAVAQRAASGAADHGDRRVVHPAECRARPRRLR